MADPIEFSPYLGWVNIPDPDNIPEEARVIGAEDLLRYEQLGVAVAEWTEDIGNEFVAANPPFTITRNPDGTIASTLENGVLSTFTYNPNGTVNTQTRAGITRTFTYDINGNLTGAI